MTPGAGEPITPEQYLGSGQVFEFGFARDLKSMVESATLNQGMTFGEEFGYLASDDAIVSAVFWSAWSLACRAAVACFIPRPRKTWRTAGYTGHHGNGMVMEERTWAAWLTPMRAWIRRLPHFVSARLPAPTPNPPPRAGEGFLPDA